MLDSFFKLSDHGTTVQREIVAGCTTFLTMAYITFVNPAILSETGMDFGAVFVATCVAAAFGTLVMGLYANYPIALAPRSAGSRPVVFRSTPLARHLI